MDAAGEAHHPRRIDARGQPVEVAAVALEAVGDVPLEAAAVAHVGLDHAVRADAGDEVLAQVGGEIGVALVAQRLDGAHDGRRIDLVAPGQRPRREEVGVVGVVERGFDQLAPPRVEARAGLGEADLDRSAGLHRAILSFLAPLPPICHNAAPPGSRPARARSPPALTRS
jgi:hypothetical protein